MSTYEEFMVILTAGILLVSILEFAIELKRTTLLENQKTAFSIMSRGLIS